MADIVLHYFPVYGLGETARMLLHYKEVHFEDRHVAPDQWKELKTSGLYECQRMPMLQIHGRQLVESLAIESYISRSFGLAREDTYENYLVECLVSIRNDFRQMLSKHINFPDINEETLLKYLDENLARNLGFIEARLVSNNNGEGFFVGETATWADVALFQLFYDWFVSKSERFSRFESVFNETAPKFKAFLLRFPATSPGLQAYIEARSAKKF